MAKLGNLTDTCKICNKWLYHKTDDLARLGSDSGIYITGIGATELVNKIKLNVSN